MKTPRQMTRQKMITWINHNCTSTKRNSNGGLDLRFCIDNVVTIITVPHEEWEAAKRGGLPAMDTLRWKVLSSMKGRSA